MLNAILFSILDVNALKSILGKLKTMERESQECYGS